MAFQTGYSSQEAQLNMTFSSLAYVAEAPLPNETILQQERRIANGIAAGLGSAGYSAWTIAWGPTLSLDRGNLIYVAQNTAANQYALVVRGTDWTFVLDWIEDFASLLGLVPYEGALDNPKIQIAAGTAAGLGILQTMNVNSSNTAILQFLQTLSPGSGLFVTGHSLGGCLASALAPVVANAIGGASRIKVYTFAAPSAGNPAFATYYNQLFRDPAAPSQSTAFRVYDTLDVVPNAWASLPVVNGYYQGFVPAPRDILDIVDYGQSVVKHNYAQVGVPGAGSAYPLTGHIVWPFGQSGGAGINPIGDALFLWQVAQQHSSLNYLSLLGVSQPTTYSRAKMKSVLASASRRKSV